MLYADRTATQKLGDEDEITWQDTLIIGLAQCLALVPGVSRSGATMTAGLLRGFDRVAVTRLSFMLSVPALTAAGVLQAYTTADDISAGVGWPATIARDRGELRRGVLRRWPGCCGSSPGTASRSSSPTGSALGLLLLGLLASGRGRGDLTVPAARSRPGRPRRPPGTSLLQLRPRSGRWSPPPRPRPGRRPCPAGRRPAPRSGPTSIVRTSTTRSTSGWSASALEDGRPQPAPAPTSPISISLVSRPSTYATTASSTPIAMAAPASQYALPVSWCRAEPGGGEHQADQGGGVLGEDGLHGRVGGQPDVLQHAGGPAARASPRSCRKASPPGDPLSHERDAQHHVRDQVAGLSDSPVQQPVHALVDGEDRTGDEDPDRGQQRPEEPLLAVPERVGLVRRLPADAAARSAGRPGWWCRRRSAPPRRASRWTR